MDFLSEKAKSITPYVAGEQPKGEKVVKLNTNENPYPPSKAVEAFLKAADTSILRKYPDPCGEPLRGKIAKRLNVGSESVFVGNGSDDVLAHTFLALFSGKRVATFDVTYSFYPVYAKLFDVDLVEIPVQDDFTLDLKKLEEVHADAVIFANPNAPTSIEVKREEILSLVKRNNNVLFVVDEAYSDFGTESVLNFVKENPNLLVIRTFSKSYSLAGARVGYAVGSAKVIGGLERIKNSFNSYPVNRVSAEISALAFDDEEYFDSTVKRIIKTRERLVKELKALGFTVLPSAANFVFCESGKISAKKLYEALKSKNIFVRHFDKARIDNYLRITVGTEEETDLLIKSIKEIL